MVDELARAGALDGALAIWSLWRGYPDNPSEKRMQWVLAKHGVPLELHHVSGHAYDKDLRRLVDAVRAERVVPIHTSAPERYASLFRSMVGGLTRNPEGMMTVDAIVARVRELLVTDDGRRQVERVTSYLKELDEAGDALRNQVRRIRKRSEGTFFATVGNCRKAQLVLDVRVQGRSVGLVTLGTDGPRTFKPAKAFAPQCDGWSAGIEWRDRRVRVLLNAAKADKKITEAMVQSELFTEMAQGSSSAKQKLLLHHQPIEMLGLPFQFPLPVKASGDELRVASGSALAHADVIARSGSGRATCLRVFEIKKPRSAEAPHALAQGVAYAAAVRELLAHDRKVFLRALGFGGGRKELRIEAAAFVHEAAKEPLLIEVERLNRSNHHFGLHAFFYRLDGTKLVVTGAEQVGNPS